MIHQTKNKKQKYTLTFIVILLINIMLFVGYIKNIIKITKYDFKAPYKAEIIRSVGVLAIPVGCVVGFLDIEDKYCLNKGD